jgi:hypothetical protein
MALLDSMPMFGKRGLTGKRKRGAFTQADQSLDFREPRNRRGIKN